MSGAAASGGPSRALTRRAALVGGLGAVAAGALPRSVRAAGSAPAVTTQPSSSADNLIQPTDPSVIPLSVRGAASQAAPLQEWQDSNGVTLASLSGDGLRLRLATPTGVPMRIQSWEQSSPDGGIDRILSLTYNKEFRAGSSFRDDPAQPSTTLQIETWWNGTAELNWDITAPDGTNRRPLGMNASYDGLIAGLALGTNMAPGAGGVELWGGTKADARHLRVYERQGGTAGDVLMAFYRGDRSSSFAWRGGGLPRLIFALDGTTDAISMGPWGVLKFAKPLPGMPILSFEENGTGQVLMASYPVTGDTKPRFDILGDGRHEWASGGSALVDTNLYRAAPALLRSDHTFQALGGLATKVVARTPKDSDFTTVVDGLIVLDSAARKLWVRVGGVWRSAQL